MCSEFVFKSKDEVINAAKSFVAEAMKNYKSVADNQYNGADAVKDFLQINHPLSEREHFSVMFLNSKNQLIKHEVLFKGSVNTASIPPRIVVQKAMAYNASALFLAHNHPSGDATPSQSDINLTDNLIKICKPLEIRVLDHFIVTENKIVSMGERHLIGGCHD